MSEPSSKHRTTDGGEDEEYSFIKELIEEGTILPIPSPENRRAYAYHAKCERVVDDGLKNRT